MFPRLVALLLVALVAGFALAQYGDISDLKVAKPEDKEDSKSEAPPKDALVLYDGKSLDNWVYRKDGKSEAKWKLLPDGIMQVEGGDIHTKDKYDGKFKLHVEFRVPSALAQARQIHAIPSKRHDQGLLRHLTMDEVRAILNAPNTTTRLGIRDRAMLHLCFAGGLRVSELVELPLENVRLERTPSIRVLGKECHSYCISFRRRNETTIIHACRQACDLAFSSADVLLVVRTGIGLGPYRDARGAGRVGPMYEPYTT